MASRQRIVLVGLVTIAALSLAYVLALRYGTSPLRTESVALGEPCTYGQVSDSSLDTHGYQCFFYSAAGVGPAALIRPGVWIEPAMLNGWHAPTLADLNSTLRATKHYANAWVSFDYPASWQLHTDLQFYDPDIPSPDTVIISPNQQGTEGISISRISDPSGSILIKDESQFSQYAESSPKLVVEESSPDLSQATKKVDEFTTVPAVLYPGQEETRDVAYFIPSGPFYFRLQATLGNYSAIDAGIYSILASLEVGSSSAAVPR